jgi:exosome complex component MTR3
MKLACTVHGPKSSSRIAPLSSRLNLSAHIIRAPFVPHHRSKNHNAWEEKDLSLQLEAALQSSLINTPCPKSQLDIIVTIIESEEANHTLPDIQRVWKEMHILSASITVASAALVDAGIGTLDVVTGGVAALVQSPSSLEPRIVLDPISCLDTQILTVCSVACLPNLGQIVSTWMTAQQPSRSKSMPSLVHIAALSCKAIHESIWSV